MLQRLGDFLQSLGQLLQTMSQLQGGGKHPLDGDAGQPVGPIGGGDAPTGPGSAGGPTGAGWEQNWLLNASPEQRAVHSLLKEAQVPLTEQEARSLPTGGPKMNEFVLGKLAQSPVDFETNNLLKSAVPRYLAAASPEQRAMFNLQRAGFRQQRAFNELMSSIDKGGLPPAREAELLRQVSPEQQAKYRLAKMVAQQGTGAPPNASTISSQITTADNQLKAMSEAVSLAAQGKLDPTREAQLKAQMGPELRAQYERAGSSPQAQFHVLRQATQQVEAFKTLMSAVLRGAPDSLLRSMEPQYLAQLSPSQQAQYRQARAAAAGQGPTGTDPLSQLPPAQQQAIRLLSALTALLQQMTQALSWRRPFAG